MEQLFKSFQSGQDMKKYSTEYYQYENDINKMLNLGVLIQDGTIKVNPIVKKSKSLSTAKKSLKKVLDLWLNNLDKAQDIQLKDRYEMVEYFKANPIGTEHNLYAHMPDGTPDKYKSGKGYAYLMNGEIISIHHGFVAPANAPKGCDRLKYESQLGMIKLSV